MTNRDGKLSPTVVFGKALSSGDPTGLTLLLVAAVLFGAYAGRGLGTLARRFPVVRAVGR